MDHSKLMADILQRIGQAPEHEKSKIIEECLVELSDAFKTLQEAFYRANCDAALLMKLIKKHDIFIQQLHSYISDQGAIISNLKMKVKDLENGTYDSVVFIEIPNYSQKKSAAINGAPLFYSDDFYTGRHGYKMCARVDLNGDGKGKGTHLSVFFVLKKGRYDDILTWPFQGRITFALLNQDSKDPLTYTLIPHPSNPSFQKPTEEMNIASGYDLFVAHQKIENPEEGFLKNDTIAIKIKVDLPAH